MSETWLTLKIMAPPGDVDLIGAALEECGCCAVIVGEQKLDTFVAPDPDELFRGQQELQAFFEQQDPGALLERVRQLLRAFPDAALVTPLPQEVRNEDWAEGWKQHFPAMRIGRRLIVRPSWESCALAADDVELVLDPGMAFGTGTHGTTRLCLEALAECFDGASPPDTVLDVGTGSGILAIAAARLGAGKVVACDIDEEVRRVAQENVLQNGVEGCVEVTLRPLEELSGGYDLVLANILAEENVRLADQLLEKLNRGGVLVLSGILQEKEALVTTAFNPRFSTPPRIERLEEWSCLIYSGGRTGDVSLCRSR